MRYGMEDVTVEDVLNMAKTTLEALVLANLTKGVYHKLYARVKGNRLVDAFLTNEANSNSSLVPNDKTETLVVLWEGGATDSTADDCVDEEGIRHCCTCDDQNDCEAWTEMEQHIEETIRTSLEGLTEVNDINDEDETNVANKKEKKEKMKEYANKKNLVVAIRKLETTEPKSPMKGRGNERIATGDSDMLAAIFGKEITNCRHVCRVFARRSRTARYYKLRWGGDEDIVSPELSAILKANAKHVESLRRDYVGHQEWDKITPSAPVCPRCRNAVVQRYSDL